MFEILKAAELTFQAVVTAYGSGFGRKEARENHFTIVPLIHSDE